MIKIEKTNSNFDREPLAAPFGFKGGYLNEVWQTAAYMKSASGTESAGVGTQSVLWSDASVFAENSENGGNAMMYRMTDYALKHAEGMEFETPLDLLDQLLPLTYEYGKKITGHDNLRLTFALNALVAVDNAAWILYCKEKGITSVDDMIPEEFCPALSYKHEKIACIPLYSYGVGLDEIDAAVNEGFFFAKIKIGADPDKDGDQDKMLDWDKKRLSAIHELLKDRSIEWTDNGQIPYYLDANGRYDGKERLLRLLDHADKIGALERISLVEEPFPEELKIDVKDVPVRLAADESVHSVEDAKERIDLGFGAITLKAIAKTMSMTLRIAKEAFDRGVPCFCADLTVIPVLVDWNKAVASRLAPLPGLKVGVVESNGHQNYRDWDRLKSYHPCAGAPWITPQNGMFELDADYYTNNGGILQSSPHYMQIASPIG